MERLKVGLPSEKDEQQFHALKPISSKPEQLPFNCEAVQPVDMVVGEDFHELFALFCSGA